MQHGGHEPASGRNRHPDRAGRTRGASRRSGRLASVGPARHAAQYHLDPVAGEMSAAQSARKRPAVPARQLALKPNLQILRRRRRPLLRGLEQPRRSTLADHVHRPSQLGPWVLINESWYQLAFPGLHVQPEGFAVVGMAALFTGIVRAPLTGIVLATEMTADVAMLLPMVGACAMAMLTPPLLKDPPIYDSLRERTAARERARLERATRAASANEEQRCSTRKSR